MAVWITADDLYYPDHPFAEESAKMASDILYHLTGEKFPGEHTVTENYGRESFSSSMAPVVLEGKMHNLSVSSAHKNGIRFGKPTRKLHLRHTPVREIHSITFRGQTLDPSSYTLRNRSFLVLTSPTGWIFDGLNEYEITYSYGAKPPTAGIHAATRLANEFLLAEEGDERCSLPQRLTAITRQNVSMTVMDTQEFLEEGKTGIYSVDLFIKTYNPSKAKKRSKIYRPGSPYSERINR